MEKYGYIRVSTREQNPERQLIAMEECGIRQKNILCLEDWIYRRAILIYQNQEKCINNVLTMTT